MTKEQRASGFCSAHQYPHPGERDYTPDCTVCYPPTSKTDIQVVREAAERIRRDGAMREGGSPQWRQDLLTLVNYALFGLPVETNGFRCKANRTADPPQDCDWPNCGCDERATKVIESLVEQGWMPVPRSASMPKRERPQESPNKSKVDYIEELASYCGLVPRFALYGLVRSRELEALLEHLANAQDDVLRLHHAYVDLKYPQTARSPEEPRETSDVTNEQAFIAAAVKALRGHRWCGDQYPENGWPDINTALALYAKLGRSAEEPTPKPVAITPTGLAVYLPEKASACNCRPLPEPPSANCPIHGDDICQACGAELVADTCDKCGAENGDGDK